MGEKHLLGLLLHRLTIFNFVVKTMIWSFNHWPWNRPSIEILRKEFKVWTEVKLDSAVWLIGKSIHRSSRIIATTIKILESYSLAYTIFEERYLTTCTENKIFLQKIIIDLYMYSIQQQNIPTL